MRSPESGQERWTNLSTHKSKSVWDILAKIEGRGLPLPAGKTTDELLHSTAGDLLDYAEIVSADEGLWTQMPDEFTVGEAHFTKEQLRADLNELVDESR